MNEICADDRIDTQVLESAFCTPILVCLIKNRNECQKEFDSIRSSIEFDYTSYLEKTHKIFPDNFWEDVLQRFRMSAMIENIDGMLRRYCERVGVKCGQYKRTSWFTACDRDDYGNIHDHGDADISGCYYYKTNMRDGNIFFLSPAKASASASRVFRRYHGMALEHQPVEGKMLLFPGWLDHGVRPNQTAHQRISLSFNIVFEHDAGPDRGPRMSPRM